MTVEVILLTAREQRVDVRITARAEEVMAAEAIRICVVLGQTIR